MGAPRFGDPYLTVFLQDILTHDLFVKAWADVTAHPPQHGEVEIYDGTEYVELEVVGSFGSIAPGAAATLDIRWFVRAMPAGAMRAAGDATLLSAVNQLVAQ